MDVWLYFRHFIMKRKLDSLLWQINYKDISWARQIEPEDEVGL